MVLRKGDATSVAVDVVRDKQLAKYVSLSLRRYAARWIRNYRARVNRESLVLNQPVWDEEGSVIEMGDLVAAPDLSAEDAYLLEADLAEVLTFPSLYHAYVELTENQWLVFVGLTVFGLRQAELARALHVSQQAIAKTKAQALKRLRSAV